MKRFVALGIVILAFFWMCQSGATSRQRAGVQRRNAGQAAVDSMLAVNRQRADSVRAEQSIRDSIAGIGEARDRVEDSIRGANVDSAAAAEKRAFADSNREHQRFMDSMFARRDSVIDSIKKARRRPPFR